MLFKTKGAAFGLEERHCVTLCLRLKAPHGSQGARHQERVKRSLNEVICEALRS